MNRSTRISRRGLLATGGTAAALGLTGCLGGGGTTGGEGTALIGVLEDRSGNFSLVGTPKHKASMLAIEEINADGGIMDTEIETFAPDPSPTTSATSS